MPGRALPARARGRSAAHLGTHLPSRSPGPTRRTGPALGARPRRGGGSPVGAPARPAAPLSGAPGATTPGPRPAAWTPAPRPGTPTPLSATHRPAAPESPPRCAEPTPLPAPSRPLVPAASAPHPGPLGGSGPGDSSPHEVVPEVLAPDIVRRLPHQRARHGRARHQDARGALGAAPPSPMTPGGADSADTTTARRRASRQLGPTVRSRPAT